MFKNHDSGILTLSLFTTFTRSRLKKSFPMFVATFLLYGGLNHSIRLLRFLVRVCLLCPVSYASSWVYPAIYLDESAPH